MAFGRAATGAGGVVLGSVRENGELAFEVHTGYLTSTGNRLP
jgi:hypothetical protein